MVEPQNRLRSTPDLPPPTPAFRRGRKVLLVGAVIVFSSMGYSFYVSFSRGAHSGITSDVLVALLVLLVGTAVLMAGAFILGRERRRMLFRSCPVCGQKTWWSATICPSCHTPLDSATPPGLNEA